MSHTTQRACIAVAYSHQKAICLMYLRDLQNRDSGSAVVNSAITPNLAYLMEVNLF